MPFDVDSGYGSLATNSGSGIAKPENTDRRVNRRFEIELEFDLFHLWGASHLVWAGSGRTRNWSKNSILIPWDKPLAAGSSVELVIRWCSGVQLVVMGRVVTIDARGVVVRIMRRRFRGKPELAGAPLSGDSIQPELPTPGHVRAS